MRVTLDLRRLGMKLAEARRRAGLSQEKLAERVGCSLNMVSSVERGIRWPSLHLLVRLAAALDTCPSELISTMTMAPHDSSMRVATSLVGEANVTRQLKTILKLVDHQGGVVEVLVDDPVVLDRLAAIFGESYHAPKIPLPSFVDLMRGWVSPVSSKRQD